MSKELHNMNRNLCRRIAASIALVVVVGCHSGTKTPAIAQTVAPAARPALAAAPVVNPDGAQSGPVTRTVFYRADSKPTSIPPVLLSKGDQAACKVKVGDVMPALELPQVADAKKTKLASLFGKKATVVVFWKSDRRMSQQQLADTDADVVEMFGKQGVTAVGVAVEKTAKEAADTLKQSKAKFTNLLDEDGKAFAQVGTDRFPRTYVLDPDGKIIWFDIEYSSATRRELHQVLRAIAGDK